VKVKEKCGRKNTCYQGGEALPKKAMWVSASYESLKIKELHLQESTQRGNSSRRRGVGTGGGIQGHRTREGGFILEKGESTYGEGQSSGGGPMGKKADHPHPQFRHSFFPGVIFLRWKKRASL